MHRFLTPLLILRWRGEFFILSFFLLVVNARSQALLCKTENGKVCAQSANSAISAQILEIAQFAQFAEIASDKDENGKVRGTPQSLRDSSPIN